MSKRADSDSSLAPASKKLGKYGRSVNAGEARTGVEVTPLTSTALKAMAKAKRPQAPSDEDHAQREQRAKKPEEGEAK